MDEAEPGAQDRPSAPELLEVIAATLTESVLPATASHAQHHVRVAANLCRILQRELEADLRDASGEDEGGGEPLPASLLDVDDRTAAVAHGIVTEMVRAKLAVNKPGYDRHGADEERSIVA